MWSAQPIMNTNVSPSKKIQIYSKWMLQGTWTRGKYIQSSTNHPRPFSSVCVCVSCIVQECGGCVNSSCINLEMIFRNDDAATRANIFTSVLASPVITPSDRVVECPINTFPVSKFTHDHTIEFSMQFMIMQQSHCRNFDIYCP